MNRGYVLTPLAEADLDDIWDHVAERFGYDLADDVFESLHRAFRLLAENPGIGHIREDIAPHDHRPIPKTRRHEIVNCGTTDTSHRGSSDMNRPEDINSEHISLRRIKSYIRNLEIPAEAKVILTELLKATVNVGGQLYRIGRKVVEIAIILATKFPALTFALILTSFINLLIAAIPLLGPVLVPIIGPLVTATGVAIGAYKDIKAPELKERMEELVSSIKELFSAASAPNPA